VLWCEIGGSSRQNREKEEGTNGSGFAGCGKPPVTVTKGGGVSAPDWRRELRHAQKGGGAERARGQGVANERRGRGAVESGRAAERVRVRVKLVKNPRESSSWLCQDKLNEFFWLLRERERSSWWSWFRERGFVLPSELCEPLGLARKTCARTRFGSRAREGRRASQRRRGRAASESVGAEEARAAGTRGNQRTSREVATPLFLFIWELNVSGV